MVNRILIRIKVVQLLYSYLLTLNEFKIDPAPQVASKDKRYAYAVYTKLLMLIIELSGLTIKRHDGTMSPAVTCDKKQEANRVGRALLENDDVKSLIFKSEAEMKVFDPMLQQLVDKIERSSVFTDYKRKRTRTLADDVKFWITVINTIIAKDETFIATLRADEAYSIAGFEAGIKQACATLTSYQDAKLGYTTALKELKSSLDKAYELYFGLFGLIIELTREQENRIENAKSKFLASDEELNPNTRFIDNRFVAEIAANPEYEAFAAEHPMTWTDDPALIRSLLDSIVKSDIYADYMSAKETTFAEDCDFWRQVLKRIILPSDSLAEALESMSIYWNDDLPTMGTFVLKTIKQFEVAGPDSEVKFLPQFKDEEDAEFGADLFRYAVENRVTYRSYIDRFINSSQWDPERLAFMDIVIMTAAIAELINYPAIPVPVTMNEYIEIANAYSTGRSGQFINGILFSVVKYLNEQGIIAKR